MCQKLSETFDYTHIRVFVLCKVHSQLIIIPDKEGVNYSKVQDNQGNEDFFSSNQNSQYEVIFGGGGGGVFQ